MAKKTTSVKSRGSTSTVESTLKEVVHVWNNPTNINATSNIIPLGGTCKCQSPTVSKSLLLSMTKKVDWTQSLSMIMSHLKDLTVFVTLWWKLYSRKSCYLLHQLCALVRRHMKGLPNKCCLEQALKHQLEQNHMIQRRPFKSQVAEVFLLPHHFRQHPWSAQNQIIENNTSIATSNTKKPTVTSQADLPSKDLAWRRVVRGSEFQSSKP